MKPKRRYPKTKPGTSDKNRRDVELMRILMHGRATEPAFAGDMNKIAKNDLSKYSQDSQQAATIDSTHISATPVAGKL